MPRTPRAAGHSSLAASLLLLQSSPAAEVESRRFGTFTAIWHRHDPQARDSVFHKDTGLGQVRNKEKRSFTRHSGSSASRSLICFFFVFISHSVCLSVYLATRAPVPGEASPPGQSHPGHLCSPFSAWPLTLPPADFQETPTQVSTACSSCMGPVGPGMALVLGQRLLSALTAPAHLSYLNHRGLPLQGAGSRH